MNRGAADEPKGENREPVARAEWRKGRRDFVSTGRKLSDEQVIAIRYRVGSGKLSQRRAAIEYEVSQKTIYGIMAGTLYRLPNPTSAPRFELVEVRPASEVQVGRSYASFPLKRRSA